MRRLLTEAQITKAVSLNRYYAQFLPWKDAGRHKAGWRERFPGIATAVDVPLNSPDARQFAWAVAHWQQERGGLAIDGAIGTETWAKMEAHTRTHPTIMLNPPLFSPSPYGAWNPRFDRVAASSSMVMPARAFMMVVVDTLDTDGPRGMTRKIGVVPTSFIERPTADYASTRMASTTAASKLGAGAHARGLSKEHTPWLTTIKKPFGTPSDEGKPVLIDVETINRVGGRILDPADLVAELRSTADQNPALRPSLERLIDVVYSVERGTTVGDVEPVNNRAIAQEHSCYTQKAQDLWARYEAREISKTQLAHWLGRLDAHLSEECDITQVGRLVTVIGVVLTPIDLGDATNTSWRNRVMRPVGFQAVERLRGWAGALVGSGSRAKLGQLMGVETGPGVILTGEIGALVFGAVDFFLKDTLLADRLYACS